MLLSTGGHSALVFLASYPNAEYLAFDQWDRHWYQNLGLEFVRRAFPDRAVTVVKGDSTVPPNKNLLQRCWGFLVVAL